MFSLKQLKAVLVLKAVYWLNELSKDSLKIAGGKGANLAEMFNLNLPVPPAFVVCADAYFEFVKKNKIDELIKRKTDDLNVQDSNALQQASHEIKRAILQGQMGEETRSQIIRAYNKLCGVDLIPSIGEEVFVAIRSSATAEDLPKFSFAGQQATFLNIAGGENVVKAVQKCWASLFEARAIYYRKQQGFSQVETGIAVIVEKMVDSDKAGVIFTVDPMSGDENKIVIEAGLGLGESVVSGSITPDRYVVDKTSLQVLDKKLARQKDMVVRKPGGETQRVEVPEELQETQKLSDGEIRVLAKLARRIEEHYGWPQDIEWAVEGKNVYIVQTRAVTTLKRQRGEPAPAAAPAAAPALAPVEAAAVLPSPEALATAVSKAPSVSLENARVLLQGLGASPGVASGTVKIVLDLRELNKVREGDVLVTEMTSPDFVPAMKRAKAIVTDSGGMTCHAAIVSRELGVPCVVGTQQATRILQDGQAITVDAKRGVVYEGAVAIEEEKPVEVKVAEHVALATPIVTGTKVYVNLAEPDQAEAVSKQNVDGVGLLRAEFMIAGLGVHPKKLIAERREQEFIDGLARGLRKICAPFHPRPVIYRATDFKTNEYRGLRGGEEFEPKEENPLIGFRGCYRYVKQPDVFRLELRALKKVRDQYGMKNLWLMIPFVRTVRELEECKKIVESEGLLQSHDFKFGIMCEVPSVVILAKEFCEVGIDFMSIGSNDLTMLTLGVDRDDPLVAEDFDERNEAVLKSIEKLIRVCHSRGVRVSLCGQAPSVYPEFAEALVEFGIDSVSVNPDVIDVTRRIISSAEKRVLLKKARTR